MITPTSIIQQHREIFRKYQSETVIDMDKYHHDPRPFYIARLEDYSAHVDGRFPLQRQSHHYFELVQRGNGYKNVGIDHFEVSDSSLVTVPARVLHSGFYEKGASVGYVLGFDQDFFLNRSFPRHIIENNRLLASAARPNVRLTSAQLEHLAGILECVLQESLQRVFEPARDEIIAVKILEFLIFSERYAHHNDSRTEEKNYHELVFRFNKLIDKYFIDERSVNFYASQLNLHPNSLNALIKFHTGLSAKSLINKRITDESKSLLANTGLSIKEIAGKLGFEDPNYFSYFFKRESGQSPVEFKQCLLLKTA